MKVQGNLTRESLSAGAREGAFKAVQVGRDLIALYPHDTRRAQPYVILLDPVSGIIKHLDLGQRVLPRRLPRA